VSPLGVTLLAVAIVAAVVVSLVSFARRRAAEPDRPWWQHSTVWVGVSAVFVLLGLFVAPKLLGFTFVFLPFLWTGGGRRPRQRAINHDGEA
jgi:O-antigen/teichoic acid export membrane protein